MAASTGIGGNSKLSDAVERRYCSIDNIACHYVTKPLVGQTGTKYRKIQHLRIAGD